MRKKGAPARFAAATFVVALVVNGLMAWTANFGGQSSHPEIRSDQDMVSVGERNEPSEALGHLDD